MKLCMKHQKPKPFIIVVNHEPGLTLTFFRQCQFCNSGFTWKNVTMMDALEIIASFDLEFGKYSKLNE